MGEELKGVEGVCEGATETLDPAVWAGLSRIALHGELVGKAVGVTGQGGNCSTRRSVLETFWGVGWRCRYTAEGLKWTLGRGAIVGNDKI